MGVESVDCVPPTERLIATAQSVIRSVTPRVISARLRALETLDVRVELRKLGCPVLYLRAKRDRLVGSRSMHHVKAELPRTELQTIDGPHFLLQARPNEAAAAIQKFLDQILPE